MSKQNKDTLDLLEGHRLAFDSLLRFVKGEEAIIGLRPKRLGGETKQRILKKLILANGMYCYWCDCKLNRTENHPRCTSLDHVIPRRFGGPNHIHNIVLACRECDTNRGRETPVEPVLKYYGTTLEEIKKYI